ncbi:ABC transporter ATP-binding protein [Ferruginivarius sediminum]|nr:ABC transporter ATP-binding protein [Ferruginivarius sediminum]
MNDILAVRTSESPQRAASPGEANETLLSVRDATIQFPAPKGRKGAVVTAVKNVSIDIRRAEKFVILGPSGCGKSTLLTAMGGFIPLSGGAIELEGRPVRKPSMQTVMVFQDFFQLLPWKTVRANVEFALRQRWPRMPRGERRERAEHFVDLVGLSPQLNQYPHTLSGGQKQRCAIARAFSVSPEVLLMDEPFGALDAINRERMQGELNRIWEEGRPTIVFVTHDVTEAVHLGHRIMVMTEGPGQIRRLLDNPHVGMLPYDTQGQESVAELREMLIPAG